MSDIMQQNTIKSINPIWGRWQILEKTDKGPVRRPTAYKTGTTDDRKDVLAYGFLAPPDDPKAQGLVVGVWMGNSDSTPNLHRLSFEIFGTDVVANPHRDQPGPADREVQAARRDRHRDGRRVQRAAARARAR